MHVCNVSIGKEYFSLQNYLLFCFSWLSQVICQDSDKLENTWVIYDTKCIVAWKVKAV